MRPRSILVVDDNEANRDVLTRRLQQHGYVTAAAADGSTALTSNYQVLGTTKATASMLIGCWSTTDTTAVAPTLHFFKSGNGSIGTNTTAVGVACADSADGVSMRRATVSAEEKVRAARLGARTFLIPSRNDDRAGDQRSAARRNAD